MPEVSEEKALEALRTHATALVSLVQRDRTVLRDVLARPLDRPDDEASFRRAFEEATASLEDGAELRRVLRRLRHRAVVRIALREVMRLADIDRTSAEMAWLASAAIDAALAVCTRTVLAAEGEPRGPDGERVPLTVLGMGKLGGGELNIGSDVDLIFFYETDEATVEGSTTTVHEIYAKVASRTSKALADVTDDGFVFRVDLRLRPEGTRGPLVNSLASAERYYETWGRTWERAALLRARAVAGDVGFGEHLLDVLRPFVYRRAVDPGIAREMAEMLRRSRRELRVDEDRDVKLGRGGIREAEFFVQTLQLIWGGRHPELQVPGTVEAIQRLTAAGLISDREAQDLETSWALLRRIEHRIHVQAGYQTHQLPPTGEGRERFARSLGFRDAVALERELDAARQRVARLFASLAQPSEEEAPELVALCDLVASGASARDICERLEGVVPTMDPDEAASHLVRLGRRATSPLGPVNRERMPELGPMLLREIADSADPDMALRYTADFFARLGGPWGYDRLLVEEPRLLRRLVGLFGASATLSSALIRHPEAVDDLLLRATPPGEADIERAHAVPPLFPDGPPPDVEELVGALRRAKRELTLHIGLAFVAGDLDLEDVTRLLTRLADEQVAAALRYVSAQQGYVPPMVVGGLGKLGGRELGFGGDLDLVFFYGEDGEHTTPDGRALTHAEICTRVAQRTMRLLSQPDAEGPGYETDTRLRPSGAQGMLVVSLASFDRYHEERAAPWERQALLRARTVAGDPDLARRVGERFTHFAYEAGPVPAEEVARLRQRIESELAGEKPDRYHPKLGYGGLVDVEFVVQYLQMQHGEDARIRSSHTLEALAGLRASAYLSARDAEGLAEGYGFFRGVEQAMKLLDETREPVLWATGRVAPQVARRLGVRDRDGQRATEALLATWKRHATELRATFDRVVAPVGTRPPWSAT